MWEDRCTATVDDNPHGFKWGLGPFSNFLLNRVQPVYVDQPNEYHRRAAWENHCKQGYLITALRDIPEHGVKAGDVGGSIDFSAVPNAQYPHAGIPPSDLLSDDGACWLGAGAHLMELRGQDTIEMESGVDGERSPSAQGRPPVVRGNALLRGTSGDVSASDVVVGFGCASISDNVVIEGSGIVIGSHVKLSDNVKVSDRARLWDHAVARDNARIRGKSELLGSAEMSGDTLIDDTARLAGRARLMDTSQLFGAATVNGDATIKGASVVNTDNACNEDVVDLSPPTLVGRGAPVLVDAYVTGGHVLGLSVLRDGAHVSEHGYVENSTLLDGASVRGDGAVSGALLEGADVSGGHVLGGRLGPDDEWTAGMLEGDGLGDVEASDWEFRDYAGKDIAEWVSDLNDQGITVDTPTRLCRTPSPLTRRPCTHPVTDETKLCRAGHVPMPA